MARDPIEIDRYYEIPKVEIPDLLGLNVLDAEEIAFSNYILPVINLIDSEETPGLILSQNVDNCDRGNKSDNTEDESNDECIGIEMPEGTVVNLKSLAISSALQFLIYHLVLYLLEKVSL